MIGNVPQATAGVQARACVSPAVTIAVTETVLTPATSWRGKGGICVLMLFFISEMLCSLFYTNKQSELCLDLCAVPLTPF